MVRQQRRQEDNPGIVILLSTMALNGQSTNKADQHNIFSGKRNISSQEQQMWDQKGFPSLWYSFRLTKTCCSPHIFGVQERNSSLRSAPCMCWQQSCSLQLWVQPCSHHSPTELSPACTEGPCAEHRAAFRAGRGRSVCPPLQSKTKPYLFGKAPVCSQLLPWWGGVHWPGRSWLWGCWDHRAHTLTQPTLSKQSAASLGEKQRIAF